MTNAFTRGHGFFKSCFTKIRDFGNFVIFWNKVNPPGYVVIDFGYNAFFTFFASNLEDTNQKNCAV